MLNHVKSLYELRTKFSTWRRDILNRVGPYRFCSDGNPTTLSILLWPHLIFLRYSYIIYIYSTHLSHLYFTFQYYMFFNFPWFNQPFIRDDCETDHLRYSLSRLEGVNLLIGWKGSPPKKNGRNHQTSPWIHIFQCNPPVNEHWTPPKKSGGLMDLSGGITSYTSRDMVT